MCWWVGWLFILVYLFLLSQRQLVETENDQKQEIVSLRDRLLMGQEAYKEKYIEWEQLEAELYKLKLSKYCIESIVIYVVFIMRFKMLFACVTVSMWCWDGYVCWRGT